MKRKVAIHESVIDEKRGDEKIVLEEKRRGRCLYSLHGARYNSFTHGAPTVFPFRTD